VKLSHHRTQFLALLQIADGVIVVVKQRRHPWDKSVLGGVVVESVPEDFLRALGLKCGELIATARGDEIDSVVAVPMLESMLTVEDVRFGRRALAKAPHIQASVPDWSLK
jgi:hypothetical protein